ncbi:MAG TPA: succinate dehydrogenase [Chloroflexota bacterium]|nr:succinate dehydrogenase [Chloroflexota bacterium]
MSAVAAVESVGERSERRAPSAERHDRWWIQPLLVVVIITLFSVYALWAALQNANYYADPYLSPFYSPCLAQNCQHITLPLLGSWWNLSPAFLVLGIPLGFRATCYYYRRSYYRAFFWSPPACAVPDARSRYRGETVFPYLIQNIHRYFFYLAVLLVVFLWWDALLSFRFPNGFGIGLGTLILVGNVAFLSLYTFSCHSCRHLCGGYLDSFANQPFRHRLWGYLTRLNTRHGLYAWISLFSVIVADVYVRLVATGIIHDLRFI